MALVDICGIRRLGHLCCLLLYRLDHILDPVDCWDLLVDERLRLQEVRLVIEELITEPDLILFVGHGFVHELHLCFVVSSRKNLKFKLQIAHFCCHLITIPLEDVLLVESQVMGLGRHPPQAVEQHPEDYADRYQPTARVEFNEEALVLDHGESGALPALTLLLESVPFLDTKEVQLPDPLKTHAKESALLDRVLLLEGAVADDGVPVLVEVHGVTTHSFLGEGVVAGVGLVTEVVADVLVKLECLLHFNFDYILKKL